MRKILTAIFLLVGLASISATENIKSSTVEVTQQELTITTTERGAVLVSSSDNVLLFSLGPKEVSTFVRVIEGYKEIVAMGKKIDYKTGFPPAMRSQDNKLIQFVYSQGITEGSNIITLTVDLPDNPYRIIFTFDQVESFIKVLTEDFLFMEEVRNAVIEIRNKEVGIRKGN